VSTAGSNGTTADIVPFPTTAGLASMPMYTLAETEDTVVAWWRGVARHMRACGVARAPEILTKPAVPLDHWLDDRLLFSQTCGFPLMFLLEGRVRVVATPIYDAPGCEGATYRSMIIVPDDLDVESIGDLHGLDVAINSRDSQSGFNAFRALLATVVEGGEKFFGRTMMTGAHADSIKAVRDGTAQCAAIDGVTYALHQRYQPDNLTGIRILCETAAAPGLPFITGGDVSDDELQAIRDGLFAAFADPELIPLADKQLLKGAAILDLQDYEIIKDMATIGALVDL
jgi:ABC-type phosphate/phosphonate transport system substrate-binding protein